MRKLAPIILIISILIASGCKSEKGKEYHVFYLGGQSNMDGYGYVSDLPDHLKEPLQDVYIFHGNTDPDDVIAEGKGVWSTLRPGHGAGFTSNGSSNTYSERFGCELSFAHKIKELNSGINIAIIKYSKGGTSIDEAAARNFGSWDPDYKGGEGINQYDHFLAVVENAMAVKDIDGDGYDDKLTVAGIIWMQGESDADVTEEIALRYYDNLNNLMHLIRTALGSDNIPVIIGRISDSGNDPSGKVWEHGDIVRKAEERFVKEDPHAAIVTTTDDYDYSDPWHYDSEGFIDLGEQFALKLDSLGI